MTDAVILTAAREAIRGADALAKEASRLRDDSEAKMQEALDLRKDAARLMQSLWRTEDERSNANITGAL